MSPAALLLPNRTPAVGEMVLVRSRRWLVEEVGSEQGATAVRLACAEDDAQGEELEAIWELELDRAILEGERWEQLGREGFDDPRHFAAFVNTMRWNAVTATDARLFQAPFRAGIKVDPYQMEPLRKALQLPRVNLFVADDTGLGKTIEADGPPRFALGVRSFVVAADRVLSGLPDPLEVTCVRTAVTYREVDAITEAVR